MASNSAGGRPDRRVSFNAHIRRAAEGGEVMLRRSFDYDEGPTAEGLPDTGLVFIAYQADAEQFLAIQQRLSDADLLNDYAVPIGSAVFGLDASCRGLLRHNGTRQEASRRTQGHR
ncbi:Dyp-type peroxidase [Glycomyces terrestris]|uniref:Dyp-type peroxidase domain-containing protein n=1 Tax=Glycomyces terrestris TaxID=2493553 RepID=UPI001315419C|nr:Dyp-type peroxidase domain-containing protein [Glycomyces terrestris]